jgi:hypothetical protein
MTALHITDARSHEIPVLEASGTIAMLDQRQWRLGTQNIRMRVNTNWSATSIYLLLLVGGGTVCCMAVFLLGVLTNTDTSGSTSTPADVSGYLRGGRILILRLPIAARPVEQIEVFEDGTVAHIAFTPNPADIYKQVSLPQALRRDLDQLRAKWCQQPPSLRALRPNEPHYILGLKCGSAFTSREMMVPNDQLDPTLYQSAFWRII